MEDPNLSIRVGVVQFAPKLKEVRTNIETMISFIERAEADLLVFPELSTSGYAFSSTDEALNYSLEVRSSEITMITDAAREKKIAVVFGFAERAGNNLYNAALAISASGEISGLYRKVHLFYYEKVVFTEGDLGFGVFNLHLSNTRTIRLGMQICYDWRFAESTRSLALQGAEIVAIPSNIVTTTGMLHETLRVRAFENKVVVLFADRTGTEILRTKEKDESLVFRGESSIINYNGNILKIATSTEESISYADITPSLTNSKTINKYNNIITDRRNHLYFNNLAR